MILASIAFYVFAAVLLMSAVAVISAKNPVHSVLFLIFSFFNAAALFVLLGAEFVAMILVIVYVGAVAVLFLFVVMMLDVDFANLRKGAMKYVPLGLVLGGVLLAELVVLFLSVFGDKSFPEAPQNAVSNTEQLGAVLYTDYIYIFQSAGMILFVAMIGAIVLTLRKRSGVRRQKIDDQVARKKEDVMTVEHITPKTGI